MTPTLPDADRLRRLYDDEGTTVREIAALARCRPQTLLAAMERARVARRGRRRAPLPDIDPDTHAEIARLGGRARARAIARSLGINREKFDLLIGYQRAIAGRSRRRCSPCVMLRSARPMTPVWPSMSWRPAMAARVGPSAGASIGQH